MLRAPTKWAFLAFAIVFISSCSEQPQQESTSDTSIAADQGTVEPAASKAETAAVGEDVAALMVPEPEPKASNLEPGEITLAFEKSVSAGLTFDVAWANARPEEDYIFIAKPDSPDTRFLLSGGATHHAGDGSPARLVAPVDPGQYEIRYFSRTSGTVLHREPLVVTAAAINLSGPREVVAGEELDVEWTGPNAPEDLIFVAAPDMEERSYYMNSGRVGQTGEGSPTILIAPVKAGDYEIRYFSAGNGTVLLRIPLKVSPPNVTINAPAVVDVGEEFEVTWQGPDAEGDFIQILPSRLKASQYTYGSSRRFATSLGRAGRITAPAKPGNYEIRYFSMRNGKTLAKKDIVVQ